MSELKKMFFVRYVGQVGRSGRYVRKVGQWVRTTKNKKTTTKQSKLGKSMWGQSHVIGPEGIGDISPLLPKRQKYQDLKYDV